MNNFTTLSYEQFCNSSNNFPLYFVDLPENHYRKKSWFKAFTKEHPVFESEMTAQATPLWNAGRKMVRNHNRFAVEPALVKRVHGFLPSFYQAYRLMRKHAQHDELMFR